MLGFTLEHLREITLEMTDNEAAKRFKAAKKDLFAKIFSNEENRA